MKDETNEKRKDDMRKTCETYTTDELLTTTPLLGSHVRIHIQLCKFFQSSSCLIWFKKFLIQFWPFSFGPGTSPTASTRFVHRVKGLKLLLVRRLGFHPHANASETIVAYDTNVDNISRYSVHYGNNLRFCGR